MAPLNAGEIRDVRIVSSEEMDKMFGGTMLTYSPVFAQVDESTSGGVGDSSTQTPATEPAPIPSTYNLTSYVELSVYNTDISGNRSQSFRDRGMHWVGLSSVSYANQANSNTVVNANVQFRYTDDPSVDQIANGHILSANVTVASEKYEFQGGDVIRQYSPMSFNGTFKGASYQRRIGESAETVVDVMGGASQTFWNELAVPDGHLRTLDRYVYGARVSHVFNQNLLVGVTSYGFDDAQNSSPRNVTIDPLLGPIYLPAQAGRNVTSDVTWKYLEHYQAKAEISNSDFTPDKRASGQTFNDWAGMVQHDIDYEEFGSHIQFARINPNYVNPFGISQNDLQEVAVQHQLRVFHPIQPFFNYRYSENSLRSQLLFATTRESFEPGFLAADIGGVTNLNVATSLSRLKTRSNPSSLVDTTTDMIWVKPSYLVGPIRTEVSVGRVLQDDSITTGSRSHEWDVGGSIEGNWEVDDWRVNPMVYVGVQETDSVGIQYVDSTQRMLINRFTLANKQVGEISGSYSLTSFRRPSAQSDAGDPLTNVNQSYQQTALLFEVAPRLPETWKQIQRIALSYQAYNSLYNQSQFSFEEHILMLKCVATF